MINKIKSKIDDYLGLDSTELISDLDMARIFGGAVRDSIANLDINDVDILCGAGSEKKIIERLLSNGYIYYKKLGNIDVIAHYRGTGAKINEPKTLLKGNSIVQLIRPKSVIDQDLKDKETIYKKLFHNLLNGVDITCCGVSYDGVNLYENYENAVSHCLLKKFKLNENPTFINQDRVYDRIHKLIERGWEHSTDDRDLSIDLILSETETFSFIKETPTQHKMSEKDSNMLFYKWVIENSKSF